MKKFEEEILNVMFELPAEVTITPIRVANIVIETIKKHFKDWVSQEDHQKRVAELQAENSELYNKREEYSKRIDELIKENSGIKKEFELLSRSLGYSEEENFSLKSQLEKQKLEIPEVPQFVADWYEENKGSLDYMIFETCRDLTDESTNEFENWFGYDENKAITTLVNMKNGYTVKEKRFYLKHIDMSKKYNSTVCVLAHGEGDVIYGHYEFPVGVFPSESDYIFTQSEIDSMAAESYEQIEVEE